MMVLVLKRLSWHLFGTEYLHIRVFGPSGVSCDTASVEAKAGFQSLEQFRNNFSEGHACVSVIEGPPSVKPREAPAAQPAGARTSVKPEKFQTV